MTTMAAAAVSIQPADQTSVTLYTPVVLSIYDKFVLGFNMRYMWSCPVDEVQLPFFGEHTSTNHLDVGVASGFFPATVLGRPYRMHSRQHLTLIDLNANSLQTAEQRVLAHTTATTVRCIQADVTAPLPAELRNADTERFDSITMFNLFHCVPGGPEKVRTAFSNFKHLLSDDGVLVGVSIMGAESSMGTVSRWYVTTYNRIGIFNNLHDRREDFEEALGMAFEEVDTWLVGMMLLFRARKPRRGANVAGVLFA